MRRLVISCEHASNALPRRWRPLFNSAKGDLASHRGFDPGALALARQLAAALQAPLFSGRYSRLVIDLNRSPDNPRRFSRYTRQLPAAAHAELDRTFYQPYRQAVEQAITALIEPGRTVLHLSVHSFTPVLDGRVRNVDIGLLYDPGRAAEKTLCRRLKYELSRAWPELRIRFNQPYRGTADGFTRWLRLRYAELAYLGIELEFNQSLLTSTGGALRRLGGCLKEALIKSELPPAKDGLPANQALKRLLRRRKSKIAFSICVL